MMNNAIVIFWNGTKCPDDVTEAIGQFLIEKGVCIPEMLKIVVKDQEALAKCLIRDTTFGTAIKIESDNDENLAVMHAVEFIGKRFKTSLAGTNGNTVMFAIQLGRDAYQAKQNVSFSSLKASDEDHALLKAIEVLATGHNQIPEKLAHKYHITNEVIAVITQIYNQYK